MLFTELMTPRRAWKPPSTGNTCSMVSAMVASWNRDRGWRKESWSQLKSAVLSRRVPVTDPLSVGKSDVSHPHFHDGHDRLISIVQIFSLSH